MTLFFEKNDFDAVAAKVLKSELKLIFVVDKTFLY